MLKKLNSKKSYRIFNKKNKKISLIFVPFLSSITLLSSCHIPPINRGIPCPGVYYLDSSFESAKTKFTKLILENISQSEYNYLQDKQLVLYHPDVDQFYKLTYYKIDDTTQKEVLADIRFTAVTKTEYDEIFENKYISCYILSSGAVSVYCANEQETLNSEYYKNLNQESKDLIDKTFQKVF